jgi:pyruvate,water dikinase
VVVGDLDMNLEPGQLVTVDGTNGAIYDGCVEEIMTRAREGQLVSERVVEQYSKVSPLTVKLSLTDPQSEDFTPMGCKSLHDVVRFCHEKAVNEMFTIMDKKGRGMHAAKRLETTLPLVMYVLDLGGGFFENAGEGKTVSPQDIKCRPMWALWFGLSDDRVAWPSRLTAMDWEEFDKISGGIFSFDSKLLASYGLVSEDYLHLMVRFGYHFSVVDAICSPASDANYVNFRFKGGGAGFDQRLLRLEFIRGVLDRYGFETSTRGDMIDAKAVRLEENQTHRLLVRLGYLMAVTRLMDMRMENEEQVAAEVEKFLADAEKRNE